MQERSGRKKQKNEKIAGRFEDFCGMSRVNWNIREK